MSYLELPFLSFFDGFSLVFIVFGVFRLQKVFVLKAFGESYVTKTYVLVTYDSPNAFKTNTF